MIKKLHRKSICLVLPLFLFLLSLPVAYIMPRLRAKCAYRNLAEQFYQREMTGNTLNLHYSIADPSRFGIKESAPILPTYKPGAELLAASSVSEDLSTLQSIPFEYLDLEERHTCNLLRRNLERAKELASFPYYEDPLAPSLGVHSRLPILLAEYSFRSLKDVEDYLSLLEQSGPYLASMLIYEKEKIAAGLSPSSASLLQAAKECDSIITITELENGTHFLQTGFQERLHELPSNEPLDPKYIESLTARNNMLLAKVFYPAYQKLSQALRYLATGVPETTHGLAAFPDGKKYYKALLCSKTGSDRSPEEALELFQNTFLQELDTLRRLTSQHPGLTKASDPDGPSGHGFTVTDSQTPTMQTTSGTPDAMLRDLQKQIATEFPNLPVNIHTVVKSVSPALQKILSPAFYLTSPIDMIDTNVIYVNPASTSRGLDLYTTLAHEGFPGHLYQNAYSSIHLLSLNDSRLRQLLQCGGYLEGWAVYAGQCSYDYASSILQQRGLNEDALRVQLEKHQNLLRLCLYSLLDVMIHYENISRDALEDYLLHLGITDTHGVDSIYEYICNEPCNYPMYCLGYLEIMELRETARDLWLDHYTPLSFHRFLLEWGPSDFQGLRDMMTIYNHGY